MEIQEETPIYKAGESQSSLLRYAAMAAKWNEPPRDALDTLTLNAVDLSTLSNVQQLEYMPFDPIVKRTEGTVREGVAPMSPSTSGKTDGPKSPSSSSKMNEVEGLTEEAKIAYFNQTNVFKTTKGAPHVILKLVNKSHPEGKADLTRRVEADVHRFHSTAIIFIVIFRSINLHSSLIINAFIID